MNPWIAVDLDGTLAEYHGWEGIEHIGAPIPLMIERVRSWVGDGKDVRIFTARTHEPGAVAVIHAWLIEQDLPPLPVTATKDFGMVELWDDRCVSVISNTGRIGLSRGLSERS
jgi:hypothetical protein